MTDFLQFVFSGLTVGAIYALAALGFSIIYNSSGVINFAQGDFLMLGGMITVAMTSAGLPLGLAMAFAVLITIVVAILIEKLAIAPAKNASVLALIIITIGASIFIQGVVQIVLGKNLYTLEAFSGDDPIDIFGAMLLPQSLWVLGVACVIVVGVAVFFKYTTLGKAMLAVSMNKMAAQMVGINTKLILLISFGISGFLGAVAGIVATPITTTVYDIGMILGMKGFVAATLGGLGSGQGAILGGLLIGLLEALVAGYISSAYKDAVPFVMIIFVLLVMPHGLMGAKTVERV